MSQADVSRLIPKLKFNLKPRRKLRNPEGPQGRHNKLRKTVTALFKYERIETNYSTADESRGYADRLISDAIKYGDCHKETMKMASYWILEKQLVHKLFKVLAPRYQNCPVSYTRLWKIPHDTPCPKCVLELRDNIFPPLGPDTSNHQNLIHNVLLSEAKKAFDKMKTSKVPKGNENILKKFDEMKQVKSDQTESTSVFQENNDNIQKEEIQNTLNMDKLNLKDNNSNDTKNENENISEKS